MVDKTKLSLIPENPGCYLMKDKDNNIIYVGKAKNLKRRVNSYFNKVQTGKTRVLVDNICSFEYIVTNSEVECLILEINLIKKYNPKYNILLKDDKTYPYIVLTNDKYPILKIVRSKNRKKINGKIFGPYPNVTSARETVDVISRVYPLRKCAKLKKDYCLYYHINECLGYCKNNIDEDKISNMTKEIVSILNGNYKLITTKLEDKMISASERLDYEKALLYKNMIDNIKSTINKQIIVSNIKYNFDVFGYFVKDDLSAMKEVIYRRYFKCLLEDLLLPDLIIVDGGETQIKVAKEVLESLKLNIKIIGLKKDDKHRTKYIIDDNYNTIEVSNELFLYLTRMQDEVHRFAITYHRNIKSKGSLSSILLNVSGIGDKRRKELLKKYSSIDKIKDASIDDLSTIIPKEVAVDLQKYLNDL